MVAEVVGLIGGVVGVITWLDEFSWLKDHSLRWAMFVAEKLPEASPRRYRHRPLLDYRVAGPERNV